MIRRHKPRWVSAPPKCLVHLARRPDELNAQDYWKAALPSGGAGAQDYALAAQKEAQGASARRRRRWRMRWRAACAAVAACTSRACSPWLATRGV